MIGMSKEDDLRAGDVLTHTIRADENTIIVLQSCSERTAFMYPHGKILVLNDVFRLSRWTSLGWRIL